MPATITEIEAAIEDLLSFMPAPKTMDPDLVVVNFVKAMEGFRKGAIDTVVQRIRRGEFPDLNTRFLPTPPELTRLCAKVEAEGVTNTAFRGYHFPPPNPLSPFEMKRMDRKRAYAKWTLVDEALDLNTFGRNCKQMKYPIGSRWVPMLNGNVYAPPMEKKQ